MPQHTLEAVTSDHSTETLVSVGAELAIPRHLTHSRKR
jgi:prefoldin subunit 5